MSHEIRKLNEHLPKRRRTLKELLNEKIPEIQSLSGDSIIIKSEELRELAAQVPEELHERIRLPFVVLRRMDLGQSIYSITGERVEEFTVKKILGLTELNFSESALDTEALYLYRPQISELLRKYHSLFVIGFGVPNEFLTP